MKIGKERERRRRNGCLEEKKKRERELDMRYLEKI